MKTIVSLIAVARIAPFAAHRRSRFDTQRVGVPGPVERRPRTPLRALWSIDPASGRLACRWVSVDAVPDSPARRDRSLVIDAPGHAAFDRFAA